MAAIAGTIIVAIAAVTTVISSMRHYQRETGDGSASTAQQPAATRPASTDASSGAPKVVRASLASTGFSYLGVYEGSDTSVGQYAQIEQFGQTIGRQPNIVLQYDSWGEPFSIPFAQAA